ncbi:hypothetical protein Psfp_03077 [Pelotomaculum sp. FP]|nr:hypothetical protein Psfp_03077 [Pelotomaculum sp. FP]
MKAIRVLSMEYQEMVPKTMIMSLYRNIDRLGCNLRHITEEI